MNNKFLGTMVLIFLIIGGICFGISAQYPKFDFKTLMVANGLMLVLTMLAFMITRRTLHERPQAFVRGVFSGTLLKMFAVLVVMLIYVMMNKTHLYKPLVFVFFGIYMTYTAAETVLMSKMAKAAK